MNLERGRSFFGSAEKGTDFFRASRSPNTRFPMRRGRSISECAEKGTDYFRLEKGKELIEGMDSVLGSSFEAVRRQCRTAGACVQACPQPVGLGTSSAISFPKTECEPLLIEQGDDQPSFKTTAGSILEARHAGPQVAASAARAIRIRAAK